GAVGREVKREGQGGVGMLEHDGDSGRGFARGRLHPDRHLAIGGEGRLQRRPGEGVEPLATARPRRHDPAGCRLTPQSLSPCRVYPGPLSPLAAFPPPLRRPCPLATVIRLTFL